MPLFQMEKPVFLSIDQICILLFSLIIIIIFAGAKKHSPLVRYLGLN